MSSPIPEDPEYPYAARFGADAAPVDVAASIPRRRLLRWLSRAAICSGVLLVLTIIVAGFFAYLATRQKWLVAELDRIGCSVSYWHQGSNGQDKLPEWLRERLGDHWW